jgi:uncharacterized SAM-binding protein YcdF (DUF218 family)
VLLDGAGYVLFNHSRVDALQTVDAIIVLGGEHDGRERYALELARGGLAATVVVSNPYPDDDKIMKRVCQDSEEIEVICLRPFPSTTRGEAEMVRRLATQRSWQTILVVTWRYHLPRTRLIFRQCFSPAPGAVIMTAVPRPYDYSILNWTYIYLYQYAGLVKALAQGDCS